MFHLDVIDTIISRRSARRIRPEPVSREVIEKMLAAAVRAPNHWLTEPWHFYVVIGAGLERLAAVRAEHMRGRGETDDARIARNIREISTVPAIIIVSCRHGKNEDESRENYAATACAVQNMLLAAHAQGAGAMWRTGQWLKGEALRQFLGVPENADLVGTVYVGYPEDLKDTPRTPWTEKTTWLEA